MPRVCSPEARRHEDLDAASQQLAGFVAEEGLRLRVHEDDASFAIRDHHRVRAVSRTPLSRDVTVSFEVFTREGGPSLPPRRARARQATARPRDQEAWVSPAPSDRENRMQRFETGIPGLDDVLLGGFFRGGVNLVVGPPGIGKTILAAQIAFHHARGGGRAVCMTVLAEPHERMIEHLRSMRFFEEHRIPDSLYFVNAYRELEKEGLPSLLKFVTSTIRERRAALVEEVPDWQELRAAGAAPDVLEENRRRLTEAQHRLSQLLIERYLPAAESG
jgi:hypothetical protein